MNARRFRRIQRALERRQPDLTVLLENVHKPHNFSAVLRTCDAVGVWEAHAVVPEGELTTHHLASGGARKWVRRRVHRTLAEALAALSGGGFRLLAAHPDADAVDFREIDYTRPVAVLLGQEKDGLTQEAIAAAEGTISIPMRGMGTSLNVSVAAALILFEAQRQREAAGLYRESRLEPGLFQRTLFEWAYPDFAAHCRRKGFDYPRLSPDGELLDPIPRGHNT